MAMSAKYQTSTMLKISPKLSHHWQNFERGFKVRWHIFKRIWNQTFWDFLTFSIEYESVNNEGNSATIKASALNSSLMLLQIYQTKNYPSKEQYRPVHREQNHLTRPEINFPPDYIPFFYGLFHFISPVNAKVVQVLAPPTCVDVYSLLRTF